jgi:hypothetical protein
LELAIQNPTTFFSELPDPGSQFFDVSGLKNYELTNHLGNVLSVVSDDAPISQEADLVCSNDYFPFGSQMLERSFSSGVYRFGFNTQERTDEIAGFGNHNTALFWEYDTRLGRRWNMDPKPNPSFSNYSSFCNNPIFYSDLLGDTIKNSASDVIKQKYQNVQNAQTQFDNLVSNHKGKLRNRDIRNYRRESGLRNAQNELKEWKGIEQKINSMISTFETVMPEEYKKLNNLPINILIGFNEGVGGGGPNNPAGTDIPATTITILNFGSEEKNTVWTGGFNGDINIVLWGGGINPFKTTYLANEFGDIDYFFKNVKVNDPLSYKKLETTGNSRYPGYYDDPTGAGQQSKAYQKTFDRKFNSLRKAYPVDKVDRVNWIIHK